MNPRVKQLILVTAILVVTPLVAWGGCYVADPLFGNNTMIFHGQVLDEADDPVAGAVITAEAGRYHFSVLLTMGWDPKAMRTEVVKVVTDEEGRFMIRRRGYRLSIKSVEHRGRLFSNPNLASSYRFLGTTTRPAHTRDPMILMTRLSFGRRT